VVPGLLVLPGLLFAGTHASAQESVAADPAGEIVLRECLVIGRVGRSGRSAVHTDALEAQIVAGEWSAPESGEALTLPDGSSQTWERAGADEEGWIKHQALRGGYAYVLVERQSEQVMLLDASGHSMVYVNGEPRVGDPYRTNWTRLPVLLKAGANHLLFQCGRGAFRARLAEPEAPIALDLRDTTLPDIVVGERVDTWGAVVVANATRDRLDDLRIEAHLPAAKALWTPLPGIAPLTVRKVPFRLRGPSPSGAGECQLGLRLLRGKGPSARELQSATVKLRIRAPAQTRKRTFISGIDGSLQYYAVNPARPAGEGGGLPALFLTCHGAAVEAIGQADAYSSKSWGHIVAPTNRRPYGFDWEDWGRIDAMEVLDLAQRSLGTDPQRTYLTGHSMGGHGVWHLAVTHPDRFAAIGPSAAWASFWSYGGARQYENGTPVGDMLARCTTPSDTLSLTHNLSHHGVYILHGERDDNVPVSEARAMRDHLAAFHQDCVYHEQPGAGHWWDVSDEPGADCVDWAPMFEFFARHSIPTDDRVRHVSFTTANPGVSARSHWAAIEAQLEQLKPSSVTVRHDPEQRRFTGTTDNVARLALSLKHVTPGDPVAVELDGQKIESIPWPEETRRIWLSREGGLWSAIEAPSPSLKGPHRYGPFKEVFRNRVLFVYGTQGGPEGNGRALAKARYDAETFWYRGNASVDVVADVDFDAAREPDRNVVLYGNADVNAAWQGLLAESPVQVRGGVVTIGNRDIAGNDLACLFIRPRPGSDRALVGAVAGTGVPGMRLAERLAYFVSGVAYPDAIAIGPEMLSEGSVGVRVAGFFGIDWAVASGEFTWKE